MPRILTTSIFALALACSTTSSSPASSPAGAQLAPWDQAKVTELANQLAEAANELYGTFYKQGAPQVGSGQGEDYRQLKQEVQDIQDESKQLAGALSKGQGREDTRNDYRDLMENVRDAREHARRVFSTEDVQNQATKVRDLLNQISPYYDANAAPLGPTKR